MNPVVVDVPRVDFGPVPTNPLSRCTTRFREGRRRQLDCSTLNPPLSSFKPTPAPSAHTPRNGLRRIQLLSFNGSIPRLQFFPFISLLPRNLPLYPLRPHLSCFVWVRGRGVEALGVWAPEHWVTRALGHWGTGVRVGGAGAAGLPAGAGGAGADGAGGGRVLGDGGGLLPGRRRPDNSLRVPPHLLWGGGKELTDRISLP